MKKTAFLLCIILLITAFSACGCTQTAEKGDFLRIHIRADSNDPDDQAVKLKVRDEIIRYLTPILNGVNDVEEAKSAVKARLNDLKRIAEEVLSQYGFSYGAKVSVKKEKFPTKTYGDVTLLAGVYEAIVFELGSGLGDNWWCIAYPTFCFVPEKDEVVYRSKIKELYEKWRNNER